MTDQEAHVLIAKALKPLRDVNSALSRGITRKKFFRRFAGTYVSPGSSAIEYLELQLSTGGAQIVDGVIYLNVT